MTLFLPATKSSLRRMMALALLPAAFMLVAGAAMADEPVVERKVKIKVATSEDGELTELDLSDLMVGETRWITTDAGSEIGVTREENGYRLDIDGEETFIQAPEEGLHRKVMVHAIGGDSDGHALHDAVRNVWVTGDRKVLHLDAMNSEGVFISGLGDLDEGRKDAIREALRSAGVDKEVFFTPAGGSHSFAFVTAGEGMAEGHGEIEVDVKMLHDKLSAETGEDGKHVIVIKKEVSSSSSDDDH